MISSSNTDRQWSWDLLTKEDVGYFHIPLCPPCSHCVASQCAPCHGVFQCLWAGRCLPLLFSLPLLSLLLLPVYLSIMPPRPLERPNKDHQSLQITYIGGPNIIRTCLPCLSAFSSNVFASSCSASSPPITHQQGHSKKGGKITTQRRQTNTTFMEFSTQLSDWKKQFETWRIGVQGLQKEIAIKRCTLWHMGSLCTFWFFIITKHHWNSRNRELFLAKKSKRAVSFYDIKRLIIMLKYSALSVPPTKIYI